MKSLLNVSEGFTAFTLTLFLHLFVILLAFLPMGNYFFPFLGEYRVADLYGTIEAGAGMDVEERLNAEVTERPLTQPEKEEKKSLFYTFGAKEQNRRISFSTSGTNLPPLSPLFSREYDSQRSMNRKKPLAKLLPPDFTGSTLYPKPSKNMQQEVDENADSYLLGDIFKDTIVASYGKKELHQREEKFLEILRKDMADGKLDMPFYSFIIQAEYYQLSHLLLEGGLQPSFTLLEAEEKFKENLKRVGRGLEGDIDAYSLVMVLQRYAENKFYPENGSGMLLDSLFHNLNDCEGGTKEILAYLDQLYPQLALGSNRGLVQTTSGDLIGHMQVYLEPGPQAENILENENGLVVETTRISEGSILRYVAGDTYPIEDFVSRYYPEILPPATWSTSKLSTAKSSETESRNIVGTSNHPLKMGYAVSSTLLTSHLYDLESIRTQKIQNEFQTSEIDGCDPNIDPTKVNRTNLFSNFVAIDGSLRKSLIDHYLADLPYWQNKVMPQWTKPRFLATYADLSGSLINSESVDYIEIEDEFSLPVSALSSHQLFIEKLIERENQQKIDSRKTSGQECATSSYLDQQLLAYLFEEPEGPGFFFLEPPPQTFSWSKFRVDLANECISIPEKESDRPLLESLEVEMEMRSESFRAQLYNRAMSRGSVASKEDLRLHGLKIVLEKVFRGEPIPVGYRNLFSGRFSTPGSREEPTVNLSVQDLGRKGLNNGLLRDANDFLGKERLETLFLEYSGRTDLDISHLRAHALITGLVSQYGDNGDSKIRIAELLESLDATTTNPRLRLAATSAFAQLGGKGSATISTLVASGLVRQGRFTSQDVIDLLAFGLLPDDGLQLLRQRTDEQLKQLPVLSFFEDKNKKSQTIEPFIQVLDTLQGLRYFQDIEQTKLLYRGLQSSLLRDFSIDLQLNVDERLDTDYGILFNKLYLMAQLGGGDGVSGGVSAEAKELLASFLEFSAKNPLGRLMSQLVRESLSDPIFIEILGAKINQQFSEISQLSTENGRKREGDTLENLLSYVASGNMIFRFLNEMDTAELQNIAGMIRKNEDPWFADTTFTGKEYLLTLHSLTAKIIDRFDLGPGDLLFSRDDTERDKGKLDIFNDYYLEDSVRESFALLAYIEKSQVDGKKIKFRKSRDIRKIKDPSKIKIIGGSRKVTRQDMSLMTLALNLQNNPQLISNFWQKTVEVAGKHINLDNVDSGLQKYLFASHYPYLTENDYGFFYSPEVVADFHNASGWGGKNDILLSSYLHFKDLPKDLPDWLLETAVERSKFERRIVKKFGENSFLPMILECTDDADVLPGPLFKAKWQIRKPFGEDIFPGTLLLIRLGYMSITDIGEIVFTEKYSNR